MPFCPKCGVEYRKEITNCVHCCVDLVAAMPESDEAKGDRLRLAAKGKEVAIIMRAAYTEACQTVEFLQSKGIDALVTGDGEPRNQPGQVSLFLVAVLPEDAPEALAALRAEHRRLLEADGECGDVAPDAMVDLDAAGTHCCPACNAAFEGAVEECPECGLFLGAA